MGHYHITVRGEINRRLGALCTTYDAALIEQDVENQTNPNRETAVVGCDDDCFGSRGMPPPAPPPRPPRPG